MREAVGECDVIERDLNVANESIAVTCGAQHSLVLVQQRDRIDERQVLLVIAPRARAVIEEGERWA